MNLAHSSATSSSPQTSTLNARSARKAELDRTMRVSKISTASLGKFDKAIDGEPRQKGIKRKFESNVGDSKAEKDAAMDVLKKVESGERRKKVKKGGVEEGGLNVRKAVRFAGREERGGREVGRVKGGKSAKGRRR